MFSLRFLRFLLFSILSVAVTTGSLLMLCPPSVRAQGGVPLWTNRLSDAYFAAKFPGGIAVDNIWNAVSLDQTASFRLNRDTR